MTLKDLASQKPKQEEPPFHPISKKVSEPLRSLASTKKLPRPENPFEDFFGTREVS